ncbi:MAG: hypothetical protein GC150_05970 [Rhizobiales bacterium]|nr:hypothetical protein [Hyphomicrobiales bacterium]
MASQEPEQNRQSVERSTGTGARALVDSARAHAYDAYLSALLAPRRVRPQLLALAAYEGEVSRVPDLVSEAMLGEIRLQWWRDAVAAAAAGSGEPCGHPVVDALSVGLAAGRLNAALLIGQADARSFDLSGGRMEDIGALRVHMMKTHGAAMQLAASVLLDGSPEVGDRSTGDLRTALEEVCAAAGIAYGIARLLASLARYRRLGADPLPPEILEGGFEPGCDRKALAAAMAHLAAEARSARARACGGFVGLGAAARTVAPALLRLSLVEAYLASALAGRHDPFLEMVEINPLGRVWRLAHARFRGLC